MVAQKYYIQSRLFKEHFTFNPFNLEISKVNVTFSVSKCYCSNFQGSDTT